MSSPVMNQHPISASDAFKANNARHPLPPRPVHPSAYPLPYPSANVVWHQMPAVPLHRQAQVVNAQVADVQAANARQSSGPLGSMTGHHIMPKAELERLFEMQRMRFADRPALHCDPVMNAGPVNTYHHSLAASVNACQHALTASLHPSSRIKRGDSFPGACPAPAKVFSGDQKHQWSANSSELERAGNNSQGGTHNQQINHHQQIKNLVFQSGDARRYNANPQVGSVHGNFSSFTNGNVKYQQKSVNPGGSFGRQPENGSKDRFSPPRHPGPLVVRNDSSNNIPGPVQQTRRKYQQYQQFAHQNNAGPSVENRFSAGNYGFGPRNWQMNPSATRFEPLTTTQTNGNTSQHSQNNIGKNQAAGPANNYSSNDQLRQPNVVAPGKPVNISSISEQSTGNLEILLGNGKKQDENSKSKSMQGNSDSAIATLSNPSGELKNKVTNQPIHGAISEKPKAKAEPVIVTSDYTPAVEKTVVENYDFSITTIFEEIPKANAKPGPVIVTSHYTPAVEKTVVENNDSSITKVSEEIPKAKAKPGPVIVTSHYKPVVEKIVENNDPSVTEVSEEISKVTSGPVIVGSPQFLELTATAVEFIPKASTAKNNTRTGPVIVNGTSHASFKYNPTAEEFSVNEIEKENTSEQCGMDTVQNVDTNEQYGGFIINGSNENLHGYQNRMESPNHLNEQILNGQYYAAMPLVFPPEGQFLVPLACPGYQNIYMAPFYQNQLTNYQNDLVHQQYMDQYYQQNSGFNGNLQGELFNHHPSTHQGPLPPVHHHYQNGGQFGARVEHQQLPVGRNEYWDQEAAENQRAMTGSPPGSVQTLEEWVKESLAESLKGSGRTTPEAQNLNVAGGSSAGAAVLTDFEKFICGCLEESLRESRVPTPEASSAEVVVMAEREEVAEEGPMPMAEEEVVAVAGVPRRTIIVPALPLATRKVRPVVAEKEEEVGAPAGPIKPKRKRAGRRGRWAARG